MADKPTSSFIDDVANFLVPGLAKRADATSKAAKAVNVKKAKPTTTPQVGDANVTKVAPVKKTNLGKPNPNSKETFAEYKLRTSK